MDGWKPTTPEYAAGVEAFKMRNFHNPYDRNIQPEKCAEWENGYNDTRMQTIYERAIETHSIIRRNIEEPQDER